MNEIQATVEEAAPLVTDGTVQTYRLSLDATLHGFQALGVLGQLGRQELEGNSAVQLGVLGVIHVPPCRPRRAWR